LVIAVAYSEGLHGSWLAVSLIGISVVALLARLGLHSFLVYSLLGPGIWFRYSSAPTVDCHTLARSLNRHHSLSREILPGLRSNELNPS
jgi:Na+/H+ antiporter NhaA